MRRMETRVAAELKITQEEGKPYFFLTGRSDKYCTKPQGARIGDKMYDWTWKNVGLLLQGRR